MAVELDAENEKVLKRRDIRRSFRVVLLDIEGTTTPITFVKDTLFPYVRKNVQNYLKKNWITTECQQDIKALQEQAEKDKDLDGMVPILKYDKDDENIDETTKEKVIRSIVDNVLWQMDSDRKITALKQLQGHIWKKAYEDGEIKGEVYDDVVPALEEWTSSRIKVYIYSSGSVEAQKLLFKYSDKGDLLKYFSGHFDTKIGLKVECESYKKIVECVGEKPGEILFITDVVKEACAATEAGMQTVLSVRPGNTPLTDDDKSTYKTIKSFSNLTEEQDLQNGKPKKARTDDDA
ncbi:enolase-phosphatase E1-like [Actinia tenebrosa]|uniref:Enolase-phosphatase E1 n=1 Tax=Actinia tenebrosa TaxID=6105 RepID=A0A6P8I0M9_ACTTE|nr:enolase-phosphatase E1-like [Actinia tenebrosa]